MKKEQMKAYKRMKYDFYYECPDCGYTTTNKNETEHECIKFPEDL